MQATRAMRERDDSLEGSSSLADELINALAVKYASDKVRQYKKASISRGTWGTALWALVALATSTLHLTAYGDHSRQGSLAARHAARLAASESSHSVLCSIIKCIRKFIVGCLPSEPLLWSATADSSVTNDGTPVVRNT